MDTDSRLTVDDVREIIKSNKLGISNEGALIDYREFSINGEDLSRIEAFYGVPLRKRLFTKSDDVPINRAVIYTRPFKEEYTNYPILFAKGTTIDNIANEMDAERDFLRSALIYKKHVNLSNESTGLGTAAKFDGALKDMIALSEFVFDCYADVLKPEADRQAKILQTSSKELVLRLKRYVQ